MPVSPTGQPGLSLPYPVSESYWLCVSLPPGQENPALEAEFRTRGLHEFKEVGKCYGISGRGKWENNWSELCGVLRSHNAEEALVAIIPGAGLPDGEAIRQSQQPMNTINRVAQNLWLVEMLRTHNVESYFQPVVDSNRKIVGYEALARIKDGEKMISGGDIIAAGHALGIAHMLDRHLHIEAVTEFVENKLEGKLFVNFIPGFISKPSIYLEGLNTAVKARQIPPKNVVIDISRSQEIADQQHLDKIIECCREQSYRIALDDTALLSPATALITRIHPDYIRLDRNLCNALSTASGAKKLHKFMDFVHASGCRAIAEGIEREEAFTQLVSAGVDYFQGYLFGKPFAAGQK